MSRANGILDSYVDQAYDIVSNEGLRDAPTNAVVLLVYDRIREEFRRSPTIRIDGKVMLPVGILIGSILVGAGQALLGG